MDNNAQINNNRTFIGFCVDFTHNYLFWVQPTAQKVGNVAKKIFAAIYNFFAGIGKKFSSDEITKKQLTFLEKRINKEKKSDIQPSTIVEPKKEEPKEIIGEAPTPLPIVRNQELVECTKNVCTLVANQIVEKYLPEKGGSKSPQISRKKEEKIEGKRGELNADSLLIFVGDIDKKIQENDEGESLSKLIKENIPEFGELVAVRVENVLRSMDISSLFTSLMTKLNDHSEALHEMDNIKWVSQNQEEVELLEGHKIFEQNKKSNTLKGEQLTEVENLESKYQKVLKEKKINLFLNKTAPANVNNQTRIELEKSKKLFEEKKEKHLKKKFLFKEKLKLFEQKKQKGEIKNKEKHLLSLKKRKKELLEEKKLLDEEEVRLNVIGQSNQEKLNELAEEIVSLMLPDENFDWEYLFDADSNWKEFENETFEDKPLKEHDSKKFLNILKKVLEALPEIVGKSLGEKAQIEVQKLLLKTDPQQRRTLIVDFLKRQVKEQIEAQLQALTEQKLQEMINLVTPMIEENMLFAMVKQEFSQPENLEIFKKIANDEGADNTTLWKAICEKISKNYFNKEYDLEGYSIDENKTLRSMFDFEVNALLKKIEKLDNKGTKEIGEAINSYYKPEKAKENKKIVSSLIDTLLIKMGKFGNSLTTWVFNRFRDTISQQVSDVLQDFERPEFFLEKMRNKLEGIKKEDVEGWLPVKDSENVLKVEIEENKPQSSIKTVSKIAYAIINQKTIGVSSYRLVNWAAKSGANYFIPNAEAIEKLIGDIFGKLFATKEIEQKLITENLWTSLGVIAIKNLNEAKKEVRFKEKLVRFSYEEDLSCEEDVVEEKKEKENIFIEER